MTKVMKKTLTRPEIPVEQTWDLTDLFASEGASVKVQKLC